MTAKIGSFEQFWPVSQQY